MPRVFIPASLRPLTEGHRTLDIPGVTVRDVVLALEERYPAIMGRLRDGDKLRSGLTVSINSELSSRGLMATVEAESEIHFITAIGGG